MEGDDSEAPWSSLSFQFVSLGDVPRWVAFEASGLCQDPEGQGKSRKLRTFGTVEDVDQGKHTFTA